MKISTSGTLLLALAFSSSTDAFVNPSPLVTKKPPSALMGYLDALSGSSGINNRGNNGGGGMGSNPPVTGQTTDMPYNTPGSMGSNPAPAEQMPNTYIAPVTAPPPSGTSNGDYDQRRRGSEMGASAATDSNSGPSYSSYMDGRGSVGAGGMAGGNGMGGNVRMSHGMPSGTGINEGMKGQNMQSAGMNDGMNSGMGGAVNQNGFQNNGIGGGVNSMHGMDYGRSFNVNGNNNMNSNHNSPHSNPYMNTNHASHSTSTRGGNMKANNPRTMSGGYERKQSRNMDRRDHEMNHDGNMDMDRRPGHDYSSNGYTGNDVGGTSALANYGGGGMADRIAYYRYDNGNDYGRNGGFGTNGGGGYPMTVSYDQYGGLRLGGRYYYEGSNEYCFDIDTNNAGSGYGIRQMGYWDILQQRASRGRKFTPGTGSRYNGRGVLVDSENMGPRAVGFPGSTQSQFRNSLGDRGYYNNY